MFTLGWRGFLAPRKIGQFHNLDLAKQPEAFRALALSAASPPPSHSKPVWFF
jgi:hypothetical protein